MDNIARFIAIDGKQIIIQPIGEIKESEIRVFLLASVFGALAHQRHFLPIHASAVLHRGEAILFAGDSGAGKSTLVASFNKMGYQVISDDISNISMGEKTGRMSVYPGYAQLKLWANSLKFLDENPEDHQSLRPHIEKFGKRIPYFKSHKPIPVKAIYIMNIRAGQEASIEETKGRKRFNEIAYHTFRQKLIEGLGVKQTHFNNVQQLSKEVIIKNVSRSEKIKKLPDLLKLLEEDILNLYS
jgi:energy-coupling factor transporter ATP-binding protein EcfA2